MLIFATLLIDFVALAIWSARTGGNGFVELGRLLRGQPAFISDGPASGGGGIGSRPLPPTSSYAPSTTGRTPGGRGGSGAVVK